MSKRNAEIVRSIKRNTVDWRGDYVVEFYDDSRFFADSKKDITDHIVLTGRVSYDEILAAKDAVRADEDPLRNPYQDDVDEMNEGLAEIADEEKAAEELAEWFVSGVNDIYKEFEGLADDDEDLDFTLGAFDDETDGDPIDRIDLQVGMTLRHNRKGYTVRITEIDDNKERSITVAQGGEEVKDFTRGYASNPYFFSVVHKNYVDVGSKLVRANGMELEVIELQPNGVVVCRNRHGELTAYDKDVLEDTYYFQEIAPEVTAEDQHNYDMGLIHATHIDMTDEKSVQNAQDVLNTMRGAEHDDLAEDAFQMNMDILRQGQIIQHLLRENSGLRFELGLAAMDVDRYRDMHRISRIEALQDKLRELYKEKREDWRDMGRSKKEWLLDDIKKAEYELKKLQKGGAE